MTQRSLSTLAQRFVTTFEEAEQPVHDRKISVNPIVLKVASWYEKVRNAMEYREEEVILRAAIERILRRRLLLGGNAKTTAEPLVKELIWAGYLSNGTVAQHLVEDVERSIDLYLQLRLKVLKKHRFPDYKMNEWTYHLMSSDIEYILNPVRERELMSNFMFQVLKEQVSLLDDSEETRNAQVFLAVRKAFDKDDVAFLRYHLFHQFFGPLTSESLEQISTDFLKGYKEILRQMFYPRKEKIYRYVKNRSAAFLVLEDILQEKKGSIKTLMENPEELEKTVYSACEKRYSNIASKIRRAVVRSVIFLLLTKVLIAFAVEGSYDRFFYGRVMWTSLLINMCIPPLLMLIVSIFIRTPDVTNSKRILSYIQTLVFDEQPRLGDSLDLQKKERDSSFLGFIFRMLWLLAFLISFGAIAFVLTKLHFNIISQAVFMFFLAIVSFLSYRISITAHLYTVGEKQGLLTPVIDFFFMPIIRVGRHLTEGIAQINFLLFLFDLLIETPFKGLFAFFDQWFFFLHAKREELE